MGTNVFELMPDGNYKIIDYIKSDDEIDLETSAKIKSRFNDDEREKRLRLGIDNPLDPQFVEFNNFAFSCRTDGRAKKQAAATARAALTEMVIDNGGMKTKIMVKS